MKRQPSPRAGRPFSAAVLAGGGSTRMGRDKAWLEIAGQSLVARAVEVARHAGAQEIFISGRADADYSALGLPVLLDAHPGAGPLAGIERALHAAAQPLVLVLAVDLPRLGPGCLRNLLGHCTARMGAVPRLGGGLEPLVAFYPKRAHARALAMVLAGRRRVRDFAEACVREGLVTVVELPDKHAGDFTNCNTPAEFDRVRAGPVDQHLG